jgi:hypothetical protein
MSKHAVNRLRRQLCTRLYGDLAQHVVSLGHDAECWPHLCTGRIYVNGSLTASSSGMFMPANVVSTSFRIVSEGSEAPHVAIDEVKFYTRALSASEVLTDFNTNGPIV